MSPLERATGPFAAIETACLSIARKLAIELADRHTQSIERRGAVTPLRGPSSFNRCEIDKMGKRPPSA
ncbi:MAG: hypothetical protein WCF79_04360 [Rhodomicrobium sp.]